MAFSVQTAALKAVANERQRTVLTSKTETMAEGLPAAASRLWDEDPEPYRGPGAGVRVMAAR
ncbi:hypothetical protein [Streptomyces sp. NPDC057582]|uniref:hypothetical protein n=1 Tax=Streptomyces sp. NPDC057582 TaxID=3346174 RepID=UPI0036C8DE7E